MALPKIDVPIHEIYLPLSKNKLKYRPFLVKEEKILLMAMESGEESTVMESLKQVINNCCLDELNVETLPIADLEYFFLQLRSRSIGEVVKLQYVCNNNIKTDAGEEKKCGNVVNFDVNVSEIKLETEGHTNKIELTKKLGIVMKYPNMSMAALEDTSKTEVERLMNMIAKCVDYIYDEDSTYPSKDISEQELKEFIESLTQKQFAKIQNFFETIPKLKKELHFKCNKCNHEDEIVVEGVQNFFV
jgi:hypothetical protein